MRYLLKAVPIIMISLLFVIVSYSNENYIGDADANSDMLTTGKQKVGEAAVDPEQKTVRSADGTRIAYTKVGSGPVPLVIVHGALNTGEQWMPVAQQLTEHFSCYVMDRWGRGGSEGRTDYSLEHEINDIVAVVEEAGPDSYLLGHSSGAIYALEAAKRTQVAGLMLYEPPLLGFHGQFIDEYWDRIHSAAQEERYEDVLSIFLVEEAELPAEALAEVQVTPYWDHMLEHTPHSVTEWEALVDERFEVDRYADISVPTLLLAGTETADPPSFATQALDDLLPNARTAWLDGEGHTANLTAPGMVAQEVIEFVQQLESDASH